MKKTVTCLCCALVVSLSGASAVAQTLQLSGTGPYYRMTVPMWVYSQSKLPALADLQVLNAASVPVPFAWIEDEQPEVGESMSLPVFAVPPTASGTASANLSAAFTISTDGSLRLSPRRDAPSQSGSEWLADARSAIGPNNSMVQLTLEIPPQITGVFGVDVQASNDLLNWSSVSTGKIARLNAGAEKIEQFQVNLNGTSAKYLRLEFSDVPASFALAGATVSVIRRGSAIVPKLVWSDAIKPSACIDQYCDYPVPKLIPVDSLRIKLSEPNTLGEVMILGQPDRANFSAQRRHRNPLYLLRRKSIDVHDPNSAAELQLLSEGPIYRLQSGTNEIASPEFALDGLVYTRIRLSTPSAAIRQLGAVPPTIEIGTYSRSLIFLGSGNAPFRLAWSSSAPGAAVELSKLMPSYRQGQAISTGFATVDEPVSLASTVNPAVASPSSQQLPQKPRAPYWLWAILAGGVLILGYMAWSLLRSMGKPR